MISIEGLDDLKQGQDNKFGDRANRDSAIMSTGRESGSYTSRSSSNQMHALPIQFYLKSMFVGNIGVPSAYILLQGFCIVSLMEIMMHIEDDEALDVLVVVFPIISLLTLVAYLYAACTNPGYVIGNE